MAQTLEPSAGTIKGAQRQDIRRAGDPRGGRENTRGFAPDVVGPQGPETLGGRAGVPLCMRACERPPSCVCVCVCLCDGHQIKDGVC